MTQLQALKINVDTKDGKVVLDRRRTRRRFA